MTIRTATCHCGRLRLTCEGEPRKISLCHCRDCQRRTGSAFSVAVFYDRACVAIEGETQLFERDSASGFPVTFHFCPGCGSNVFWLPARRPDRIGVAAGAFEDPAMRRPDQAVWAKDRHLWLSLPDDMPQFEENPPPRPGAA